MTIRSVQRWRSFSCAIAVVLLAHATIVRGESSTVIGTITYKTGRPAVNVLVTIGSGYRYTDVGGRYRIDNVPQGRQRMTIKSGQNVLWQGDATINGTVATINHILP